MYIGEVARQTGASPKAIRLYEKMRLIPTPERKNSYRYYNEQHVFAVTIIKESQRLGFKLAEIRNIMSDDISCEEFPWVKALSLIMSKIESNKSRIEDLTIQNEALVNFSAHLEKSAL